MPVRATYVVALGALALASCTTSQQGDPDPQTWGRFDCVGWHEAMPAMHTQFEQARAVCSNRSEAAAISGTASMPVGYGVGGAIASGINAGITGAQIRSATANSCMAEYGFVFGRKSEHDARCPAPPPAAPPVSKRKK